MSAVGMHSWSLHHRPAAPRPPTRRGRESSERWDSGVGQGHEHAATLSSRSPAAASASLQRTHSETVGRSSRGKRGEDISENAVGRKGKSASVVLVRAMRSLTLVTVTLSSSSTRRREGEKVDLIFGEFSLGV